MFTHFLHHSSLSSTGTLQAPTDFGSLDTRIKERLPCLRLLHYLPSAEKESLGDMFVNPYQN